MTSLLAFESIGKSFPGVRALSDVSFTVDAGRVHGLLGENGAGKSTLVKTLTGIHRPDAGSMQLDGKAVTFSSPRPFVASRFQALSSRICNRMPE